jgi:hypothetical protein
VGLDAVSIGPGDLSPRWGSIGVRGFTHGLRRGLHSYAPSRLTARGQTVSVIRVSKTDHYLVDNFLYFSLSIQERGVNEKEERQYGRRGCET